MILNNFFRPLHIFPMLLGHQEALLKHLHHSWSQSIQFPENWQNLAHSSCHQQKQKITAFELTSGLKDFN